MKQISPEEMEAIKQIEKEMEENGGYILQGRLADILIEHLLTYDGAKNVLDYLGFKHPKVRHYIHERLRAEYTKHQ